jgi:hypothetical protein
MDKNVAYASRYGLGQCAHLAVSRNKGHLDRFRAIVALPLSSRLEAWIYTTTRTTVLPVYYYYPGVYRFGYFRGGVWRHHHHFYSFGLYSYPFDPYPYVVAEEVPYKTVYFEGDRCTGWEYLHD